MRGSAPVDSLGTQVTDHVICLMPYVGEQVSISSPNQMCMGLWTSECVSFTNKIQAGVAAE